MLAKPAIGIFIDRDSSCASFERIRVGVMGRRFILSSMPHARDTGSVSSIIAVSSM